MTDMNKSKTETIESKVCEEKTCFVIMPIADHPDYETGHFDRVYNYLIKPACISAGYKPIRADDTKASNLIMFDILKKITQCDMAICDISSRNANVFYELGLRQAFNKKTIMITDGRLPAPFDISAFRYVPYSPTLRVDTVEREKPAIVNMLKETQSLPEDDVNSIIKLLQIQPAEVKNIDLNSEQSVLYEMLMMLQKQMTDLKKNIYSSYESFYTAPSAKPYYTKSKREKEFVDVSGLNFLTILNSFPDHLGRHPYSYRGDNIGHVDLISPKEVIFVKDNEKITFPKDDATLSEIYAM